MLLHNDEEKQCRQMYINKNFNNHVFSHKCVQHLPHHTKTTHQKNVIRKETGIGDRQRLLPSDQEISGEPDK
jgi:hypothetical protein